MQIEKICEHKQCTGCSTCMQICPKSAITMKADDEGFIYPVISDEKCIGCRKCIHICPANSTHLGNVGKFYMGKHKDKSVLSKSSSGGMFTALADYLLKKGGVVFGAVRSNVNGEVYHTYIQHGSEIGPLRLSKYYQSNINDSYLIVRHFLEEGRFVLFSGTACQIAGLYAILGAGLREKLITVDVLCHGVASKLVVDEYIKSKEKKFKKKISSVDFRVKTEDVGWTSGGGTRMKLTFEDGTVFVAEKSTDTFFTGFNRNIFLRESCYSCRYCGMERISDFTIADFWGCPEELLSKKEQKEGVSVIVANTDKANMILDMLKDDIDVTQIEPEIVIRRNKAFIKPQDRPAMRNKFFKYLKILGYDKTVELFFARRYSSLFIKHSLRKLLGDKAYEKVKRKISMK